MGERRRRRVGKKIASKGAGHWVLGWDLLELELELELATVEGQKGAGRGREGQRGPERGREKSTAKSAPPKRMQKVVKGAARPTGNPVRPPRRTQPQTLSGEPGQSNSESCIKAGLGWS